MDSLGAPVDAGSGGQRGLPLVPWPEASRQGSGRFDAEPEPPSPISESTIYQEIFDEIVLLAVNKGLASGTVLYTDSTHLKANANKNKFDLAGFR